MDTSKVKYVFVVGIGGSDLASKAVWNAITLHKNIDKKAFFLESPDEREYSEIENLLPQNLSSKDEVVLFAISKSGKTVETLETYHKIFEMLSEKFGNPINDRVIVITTPSSPLWNLAEMGKIECIPWDGEVGGRFSAFTIAHTQVLSVLGIDAGMFAKSGEASLKSGEANGIKAEDLASMIAENFDKGVDILDYFFFNSELEDLGKWCRQLIAESLGKENIEGKKIGITPTVSIGPVDLHSMLQLTLGGPNNRFTIFVNSEKENLGTINGAAFQDTITSYAHNGLPHMIYKMNEIREDELGKFMGLMMAMTLKLAEILKVDPYGQDEVEEYKTHLHQR